MLTNSDKPYYYYNGNDVIRCFCSCISDQASISQCSSANGIMNHHWSTKKERSGKTVVHYFWRFPIIHYICCMCHCPTLFTSAINCSFCRKSKKYVFGNSPMKTCKCYIYRSRIIVFLVFSRKMIKFVLTWFYLEEKYFLLVVNNKSNSLDFVIF